MKYAGLGAVAVVTFFAGMMVVDGPGDLAALLFLLFGAKPLIQGVGQGLGSNLKEHAPDFVDIYNERKNVMSNY